MATVAEDFEIEVKAAEVFIKHIGNRKAAEYLVHQQRAIDGLTENNEAWVKAWREVNAKLPS